MFRHIRIIYIMLNRVFEIQIMDIYNLQKQAFGIDGKK